MTTLIVDGPSYATAADSAVFANRLAASCYDDLGASLAAYAAMAGTDSTSAEFASAYDAAAREVLDGWRDLVSSCGALVHLIAASLANHARAEHAVPPEAPRPVTVARVRLPSALGGSSSPPALWDHLVAHLEGFAWPDASCSQLRSAAARWRSAAQELELLPRSLTAAHDALAVTRSPEVPVACAVVDSVRLSVYGLADGCRALAESCADYADRVEEHRAVVCGILHDLAVEAGISIVAGVITSFVTAGGGAAVGGMVAGWRITSAARRVVETLRALQALARAGAIARLTGVVGRIAPVRSALARLAEARRVREVAEVRRLPGDPLPDHLRPAAAGSDWTGKVGYQATGDVWQSPRATHREGDLIRVMEPTDRYPDGYVRFHNAHGQAIGLDGRTGVPNGSVAENREHTHIAMDADGNYPTPRGWNP